MNLQILDFNIFFFNIYKQYQTIIKTSIDIRLDCLKSKKILKKINLFQ